MSLSLAISRSSRHLVRKAKTSSASTQPRLYSTTRPILYSFDTFNSNDVSGVMELNRWPITKANTILNIVPQGNKFVVERLGKMSTIHDSGFFFAIPFVDQIAYIIDERERAIRIEPQSAITRDNVSVDVSGNLFVQFVDPEKAAYGARNPLYSVMQVSQVSGWFIHINTYIHCHKGSPSLTVNSKCIFSMHNQQWGLQLEKWN